MRKSIEKSAVVLVSALVLFGCSSRKTMPSLEEAGKMEEAQLKEELSEFGRSEINAAWGEGIDPFFGVYGEVFPLDDERALILYYEGDGQTVKDVRIGENIQKFEGTIKEIHGGSAVVEADEGFPIRSSGDLVSVTLDETAASAKPGDRVRVTYSGAVMESYPLQLGKQKSITLLGKKIFDRIPMVMVDGKLYQSIGEVSDIKSRCGVMDGEIVSTVEGTDIPSENGQSNFGTGYRYQIVDEGQIDVYMPFGDEEEWVRFETKKSKEPSVVKTYEVTDSESAFEDDEPVTMVRYYEMSDGTWKTDDYTYQYRLEISGRMGAAAKDTTFVFLSNRKDITFEQAWKASGLSSNMNDYFKEEDAKFVAFGNR
ncbi:MAG: hypothetical protein Q4E24_16480 [bacterium]|nr:hypothetical protein [bacterium]